MKKKVIAYTHFHWDREWYKEYEKFRFRLLKSFNIVLDMLQSNKLPTFYFDGQTSALLDYLEIYPEKKDLIKSLVEQKKLFIGPFYCLVDEFLTSKEAFKKNLELGLKTAQEFGCKDFLAYFADTFGHSACTIPILKEFGIDKAMVWRGCGDVPAEFTWHYKDNSIKTVNLIRGYFNDIFSTSLPFEKKLEFTKTNLDLIAEKSSNTLLLPIGADHLAVPTDLQEQIEKTNAQLDDYEIVLGSPFDYFNEVEPNFDKFDVDGELRDNSRTFILEGCYSSRLDIKKYNIIASHRLNLARKLVEYNYKTLVQVSSETSTGRPTECHPEFSSGSNNIEILKRLEFAPRSQSFTFCDVVTVGSICSLSGLTSCRPSANPQVQNDKTTQGFYACDAGNTQHALNDGRGMASQEFRTQDDYTNLIDYAYKLLIQNQAHDSICGCSTDDVHKENIIRYKKILQIADSIINDFILSTKSDEISVLNLGNEYVGELLFRSEKEYPFQIVSSKREFPADIFNDIYKIPVTEDYTDIYTYSVNCKANKGLDKLCINVESDVFVSDDSLGNSNIFLQVKDNSLYVSNRLVKMIDYEDLGDSYNYGPNPDDNGRIVKLISSKVAFANPTSSGIELKYLLEEFNEEITVLATLFAFDDKIRFNIKWNNTHKNHLLQICFDTGEPVTTTYSEDLNEIIKRKFDPCYEVRKNLPKERGHEVMMNNAPMQRGVYANGVAVVTEGITQYEVLGTELRLPLLRATGVISNPKNTARTTPAGPPIEVEDLQQIGLNEQRLWVGGSNDLRLMIDSVYNDCIVIG